MKSVQIYQPTCVISDLSILKWPLIVQLHICSQNLQMWQVKYRTVGTSIQQLWYMCFNCWYKQVTSYTECELIKLQVVMGVSYSVLASALWPLVSHVIPPHQIGTAYGMYVLRTSTCLFSTNYNFLPLY